MQAAISAAANAVADPRFSRARALPPVVPGTPAFATVPLHRRRMAAKQVLYRAGQPRGPLLLVEDGCFKTCLLSADGREQVTGFRFAGDILGLDALGRARNPCDAVCIAPGTVAALQPEHLRDVPAELGTRIVLALAQEVLHTWHWMLTLRTLCADRRVAAFVLELDARTGGIGRGDVLPLPMTRSDIGNFLALQLETVVRALARLEVLGLVRTGRRFLELRDRAGLARFARVDVVQRLH
jgi:CRP/FNR family transcriptional regulator, anaerobic regulatory protein